MLSNGEEIAPIPIGTGAMVMVMNAKIGVTVCFLSWEIPPDVLFHVCD
jgi:hypothetical protein